MSVETPEWFQAYHKEVTENRQAPKKQLDWTKLILFLTAVGGTAFAVASYLFVTEAQQKDNELFHAKVAGQFELFANTLEAVQQDQQTTAKALKGISDKIEKHEDEPGHKVYIRGNNRSAPP